VIHDFMVLDALHATQAAQAAITQAVAFISEVLSPNGDASLRTTHSPYQPLNPPKGPQT
jgi:hypothetical protein